MATKLRQIFVMAKIRAKIIRKNQRKRFFMGFHFVVLQ